MYNTSKLRKKGDIELDNLEKLIIALVLLVVLVVIIILLKGKGISLLDKLKQIIMFR